MSISVTVENTLRTLYGDVPALPLPRGEVGKFELALAAELFGQTFGDYWAMRGYLEEGNGYERHDLLNRHMLEATGLGPNAFRITSLSYPDLEPTENTTLLDYDKESFASLEEVHEAVNSQRVPRPYRVDMYYVWTQSIVDGKLVYGFLTGAGQKLWEVLEDDLTQFLDDRFPQAPLEGTTPEEISAELERLVSDSDQHEKERMALYLAGRELIRKMLVTEGGADVFENDEPWVRRTTRIEATEVKEDFVFSNQAALSEVRFGSFHADVDKLPDGSERFETKSSSIRGDFISRFCRESVG